jgi:GTP pyrophosphokinase
MGKIGQKEIKAYQSEREKTGFLSYLKNPFSRSRTEKKQAVIKSGEDIIRKQLKEKPDTLLIGDDQQTLNFTLAQCCNPIPGDDVFGFITISEGIKIHRNNCPNAVQLMSKFDYRVVKAKWVTKKDIAFLTGLRISGIDEIGLLQSITNIISSEYSVNIRSINIDTNAGTFDGTVMLYINDTSDLKNLIDKLKRTKGVKSVARIGK